MLLLSFRYLVAAIASLHRLCLLISQIPPQIFRQGLFHHRSSMEYPLKSRHRTSYFAYVSSLSYVFSLFGPILASTTMSLNLWLPFYLGIGLLIGALPIIAFLPQPALHRTSANEATEDATEETPLVHESISQDEPADTPRARPSITKRIFLELKDILYLVIGRPNFQQLLVTVLILGIASSNIGVLVLYISKRYGRTFAEVSIGSPRYE